MKKTRQSGIFSRIFLERRIDMYRHIEKDEKKPHIVHEAICLSCLHRWIEVRPQGTLLKDLECPHCKNIGGVIATGQEIEGDNV
jgi:hypothetical protein